MSQTPTESTPPAEPQALPPKKKGCFGCLFKGVAVAVLLLIIAVTVAVVLFANRIDEIARRLIEQEGTRALGVQTQVEKVDLGILVGECDIDNVAIANAPDFQDKWFLQLEHGEVALAIRSLREDTIELPYLRLTGIDVYVEKKSGKANYQYIMEHIQRSRGEPQEPTAPGAQKKFVIRELVIDNVTAHVTTDLMGGTRDEIILPTIRMSDVGSDTDYGAQLAEITDIIVRSILATLVQKGVGQLPAALLGEMQGSLEAIGPLKDLGIETIGDLSGAAQDIVGSLADPNKSPEEKVQDVTDTVTGTVEKAGERAGSILEGLGGALGGKKDENQNK